jgi:WD40 repeat protein
MLVAAYRGVLLYGDSGVGKSSLVNAGLLPIVIEDGRACERLRVQPRAGEEIVLERIEATEEKSLLNSVLAPHDECAPRSVFSTKVFEQQVRAACEYHELLLVFDHFEDIIVLFEETNAEEVKRRFIRMLVGFLREESLPVKLLFVFREDYLGRIKELLAAYPNIIDWSLRLPPPKTGELQRIIRGPFERYPGHYTPEISSSLTQRLCVALTERFGVGNLSLSEVQTVCLRLWQSERPEWLLNTQGLQGILEEYLDEELDALTPEMRDAAIALLSQMVTSAGTRNVISAEDLVRGIPVEDGISPKLIKETLHQLDQKSRLVHCERRRELQLYEITSEFLVPWISDLRERLRRQRERRNEERRRRVLWRIAFGAGLIFALLAVLTVWALSQRSAVKQEAAVSHREAASVTSLALLSVAQKQLEHRPDISLLLALDAYQISPKGQARNLLVTALQEARNSGTIGLLHGPTTTLTSLAFSPNGELLASGANEGTVRLWNVKNHKQLAQISAGTLPVKTVAFSPDGHSLVAGDEDGTVSFWNSATQEQLSGPIHTHDHILNSIAFSPTGRTLATGGVEGLVRIWSFATHKELGAPIAVHAPVGSVAFSPNGQILASGDYRHTVQMWSIRTHRQLGNPLRTSLNTVTDVAFSPDGHILATLTTELFGQGRIQLWDVATRRQLDGSVGGDKEISGLAFSPNGQTLAGGGNGGTIIWSVTTGREIRQSLRSSTHITAVAFGPDGKILASGGDDHLINISSTEPVHQFEVLVSHRSGHAKAKLLALGSDGHTAVTVSENGQVSHWDVPRHAQRGTILDTSPAVAHCRVLSSDGRALASENNTGTIRLWNLANGQQLGKLLSSPTFPEEPGEVESDGGCGERLAFSPNGQRLAAITGQTSDGVQFWDVTTRSSVGRLYADGESFSEIAFSPDGGTLVSVSRGSGLSSNRVQLWSVMGRSRLGQGFTIDANVGRMVLSSDTDTLAFIDITREPEEVGKVLLWNIVTHKQLGQLPLEPGESIGSIGLSPDGRTFFSVSGDGGGSEELGGEVRLWDLATREPLGLQLTAGGQASQSVVFNQTGNALAFLDGGGAIRLWRGVLWHDLPELRNEVCGLVGEGLTRNEWTDYVPGIPYKMIC